MANNELVRGWNKHFSVISRSIEARDLLSPQFLDARVITKEDLIPQIWEKSKELIDWEELFSGWRISNAIAARRIKSEVECKLKEEKEVES